MKVDAPSRGLGPYWCFAISMVYLLALIAAAIWYARYSVQGKILGITDSYRIISIAWAGALGAVMASLTGIRRSATETRTDPRAAPATSSASSGPL